VQNYLAASIDSTETRHDIAKLSEEYVADLERNLNPPLLVDGPRGPEVDSIVRYVQWLIDRNSKSTALKSLQGKIWSQGYSDGTLKAQVFCDVPQALERWHHANLKISIFSSGSVLAQQLLFSHTEAGDLTQYIDWYFDTTTGAKGAPQSYELIAAALREPAEDILFISDVVGELNAARAAGMQTLLCVRPGNDRQAPSEDHKIIQSFDQVTEQKSAPQAPWR
jgi:enolase-phosphatase E1